MFLCSLANHLNLPSLDSEVGQSTLKSRLEMCPLSFRSVRSLIIVFMTEVKGLKSSFL